MLTWAAPAIPKRHPEVVAAYAVLEGIEGVTDIVSHQKRGAKIKVSFKLSGRPLSIIVGANKHDRVIDGPRTQLRKLFRRCGASVPA